jgi:hypothetical protein
MGKQGADCILVGMANDFLLGFAEGFFDNVGGGGGKEKNVL